MTESLRFDESILQILCCPICKSKLELLDKSRIRCKNPECSTIFPILNGIPILINESSSIFSIQEIVQRKDTFFRSGEGYVRKLSRYVSRIGRNIKGKKNYLEFADLLLSQNTRPRVLIIGGRIIGQRLDTILYNSSIKFIETDVAFGPRTILICDAHDLPFIDESLDGVVVQAVLEHVVDPYRCVEEIHRVLDKNGLVYAETPFMQQVHGGRYDFIRFTHLGHRRLFRKFEEIDSGAVAGPGIALAWSYQYFLLSFVESQLARWLIKAFARFTSFWLNYFDYYLIEKPGTLDAASIYYFLGRKSDQIISDRDLIQLYRGCSWRECCPFYDWREKDLITSPDCAQDRREA